MARSDIRSDIKTSPLRDAPHLKQSSLLVFVSHCYFRVATTAKFGLRAEILDILESDEADRIVDVLNLRDMAKRGVLRHYR
ncbi:hypothetical protein [Rhizobium sp. CF142]|uniref:hypothetical protein n=1 Tax=Rhizobium sp. CF142 TaxID=1144314 RepID=UPI000314E1E8|nr:hypothetical protein [Rhizobium sp. CF142]